MKFFVKLLLGFALFLNSACTTQQINRNSEYQLSEAAFRSGDVDQALRRFPTKEKGGFITSSEKSWLNFWSGGKENEDLQKQVATLDSRRYTSIAKETQYFFYNESEDGYIPAEHEIIVMHILNAMFYLRQEKWEAARVEARRAVFFLQNYFREDQDHFDDPALRVWLSGVWAALGEWQEAQVDLRRAYELTQNKALLPLIEMSEPPKEYTVIFSGGGPTLKWHEGDMQPEFKNEISKPNYKASFDTMPWFRRHQIRNSEIRDVVKKSNYMAQYYGLNTSVGAEKTVGFVASNSLRATGLIVGGAIVFGTLAAAADAAAKTKSTTNGNSGSDDGMAFMIGLGLSAGYYFWDQGDKVSKNFQASSEKNLASGLDELHTYRYVRFMPNWISVTDKFELQTAKNMRMFLKAPSSKTQVLFLQDF